MCGKAPLEGLGEHLRADAMENRLLHDCPTLVLTGYPVSSPWELEQASRRRSPARAIHEEEFSWRESPRGCGMDVLHGQGCENERVLSSLNPCCCQAPQPPAFLGLPGRKDFGDL